MRKSKKEIIMYGRKIKPEHEKDLKEIAFAVFSKFREERAKRREREGVVVMDGDYRGEEPEATKLAKRLCKERGVPFYPEMADFSSSMDGISY